MKIVLPFILILCLCACGKNAFEQFEKGDTQAAYKTLLKKAKKKKLERKELKLFKSVISELILEDSIAFYRQLSYNEIESDIKAYGMYDEMQERDEDISKVRYKLPRYTFLNRSLHDDLSNDILEIYYAEANELLIEADNDGEKLAAREAYEIFQEMEKYHTHDKFPLKEKKLQAESLGKEYVLVSYDANTFGYDWEIERNMDINFYNSPWREYHEDIELNVEYDYIAEVSVNDARFNDRTDTRTRNYNERIITGYNTQTDTSGVKTETPIYENVTATLFTDVIERTLFVSGEVEIRTRQGQNYDRNIREQYTEEAEQFRYSGDVRALPSNIQNRINQEAVFSSESRFYQEVMDDFMDEAKDIIEDL